VDSNVLPQPFQRDEIERVIAAPAASMDLNASRGVASHKLSDLLRLTAEQGFFGPQSVPTDPHIDKILTSIPYYWARLRGVSARRISYGQLSLI